jgi:hypothetical protein
MKQLLSALLIIFLFFGCGGGGGSSSEPTLIISSNEAVPGSFITIEDNSIKEGETLNVTFEDTSGYEVTIKTILTEEGFARVPVPPVVNLSTGDFTSAKTTVSIPSGGEAPLKILPLPELLGVPAGDIVRMYLVHTKKNFQTALNNLDQFATKFSYDTSKLEQQLKTQITSLDSSIKEIDTSAQMSMYSFYDGEIILDQNDLGKLDQLLFAILKGAMEEDLKKSSGKDTIVSANILSAGTSELTPAQLENWVNNTIKDSKTVLVGVGGMVVTVAGAVMGAKVAAGATILYTFQATGATILVVGTASEGLAAIRSFINQNNLDPDQVYVFGNEFQREGWAGVKNMGLAAGSEISDIINLYSFIDTEIDVREALSNLICNANPVPLGFENYCKEWEASHQPQALAIKLLRFYDEVMPPLTEGELVFWLEGNGDAGSVDVTIDWGDGDGEVQYLAPGKYHSGMKHSFYLGSEDSRVYTIKIHAKDRDGNEAWENTKVLVTNKTETSVAFSSLPPRIKTNKKSAWGITIEGINPPYDYSMSWGDGTKTTGVYKAVGDLTLNHTYTAANIYTVKMDVTDAKKVSASISAQADVRNPVTITSISGPTGLDLGEAGTWIVSLDGGWKPYAGFVSWGDGTPKKGGTSQSRQFTVSHAYSEEDKFTFRVEVTDDEGDSDAEEFTVKVPEKADLSFPITWKITCNDPDVKLPMLHAKLTVNGNDTITMTGDDGFIRTTDLYFNAFTFTWITTYPNGDVWTEVFGGTIDINESTGVITGSGDYSTSGTGDLSFLSCTGTWTSD